MEGLLAEILINASWAGATVIFIWKIGEPVTQQILSKFQTGGKQSFNELQGQVQRLEFNHIEHLQEDIERLKEEKKTLRQEIVEIRSELNREFSDLKGRIIRIETMLKQ